MHKKRGGLNMRDKITIGAIILGLKAAFWAYLFWEDTASAFLLFTLWYGYKFICWFFRM